jgi:Alpha/beta hydrolase domain
MPAALAAFGLVAAVPTPGRAEVVRLEILSRQPANNGGTVGAIGTFEIIRGRVHGEIDPNDPHNAIIQDLALAPRNARGRVEYVATFALARPTNLLKAARVLLYQVVNRGNGQVTIGPEGYISLISGWQGDVVPTPSNQTIEVPVARQRDGSAVTGPVLARFSDVAAGTSTVPIRLSSMGGSPQQYLPADVAETAATLTMHASETPAGVEGGVTTVPRNAWAFADCTAVPFPGTSDPSRLCLKDGFRADRVYELVYTAKDPLVLGVGLAATRDIVSFFRYATRDREGNANPVAGAIDHAVSIGDSQSGNFIKTFIHLGFNADESNRIVWDGAFPRIAARQTPMNFRFALPGGAATLYEPGSEGVLWWGAYEDRARGLPKASLLDRCSATHTCPKIIEAFGSTEFWGLRMSPDLIGTDATSDIPLPDNVRRYYYPGTTHGGGRGGFRIDATAGGGRCVLPGNPNPEADTTRALTRDLVDWVAKGIEPPASRYPLLARGELVPATREAVGLPQIPGLTVNDAILNPVLDYDFGPTFNAADVSGVMTHVPPRIRQVIPTYVPTVNADGNETAGVPSVLMQAPLGTYLGWNLVRAGFFAGQGCGFTGGYVPFAKTKADRMASHDPRPSVEERYGTLEGYVCTVKQAIDAAVRDRFLLDDDAERLLSQAMASNVLPKAADSTPDDRAIGDAQCATRSRPR